MSRSGKAAKGFLTSLLQFASQIVLQAVLAPVVLKYAGREALGAYAGIMQVLNLLTLVDIAHSWSLARFLGQSMGADDGGARFRIIFTTARTLSLISNCVFSILVLAFSLVIARMFHLSAVIAIQAQHALYVIAAWAILRTPLAAYMNASVATQDMAAVNLIATVLNSLRGATSLIFVIAGGGLFGLMLSGTLVEACGTILYRVRFKRKNPHLMPGWGLPEKPLLREMVSFGFHAMFLNVGNLLVFSSGNALAGMTNGAAAASSFYTSQLPTTSAYWIVLRLSDNTEPAINELYGRKETERLRAALLRLTRFMLLFALPLGTGVLLFNRDLIVTWVGEQQYAGQLLTSALAAYCLIVALQRVGIVFSFTFGWMRMLTVTAFAQGVVNFGLGWVLGKRMGLGGIALALVVVVIPATAILWRRLGQHFEFNPLSFLSRFGLRMSIPLLSAVAIGLLIHFFAVIRHGHFAPVVAEGLAFLFTYALVAYPFLVEEDRNDVRRYLKGVMKLGRDTQRRLLMFSGGTP